MSNNSVPFHTILPNLKMSCNLQFTGAVDARPPLLDGKPGMAKTALIVKLCEDQNWGCLIIKFADQAIEEFTGIPLPQKIVVNDTEFDGTVWTISDILTDTLKMYATYKKVVVFFDDIHYASSTHMQYLHSILDKSIKGHKFPKENLAFILARNTSSKAGARVMTSPISNRCKQMPVHMDFNYWKTTFAYQHGVNAKILTFLNNSAYNKYFHADEEVNNAWASPRSWTGFSLELNTYEEYNGGYADQSELIYHAAGYVGQEAASAFALNYELYLAVDIVGIFDKKIPIVIPTDHIKQYMLSMATVSEVFNRYYDPKYEKQKEDISNIAAQIFSGIGEVSTEIVIAGFKEIIALTTTFHKTEVFMKIKAHLNSINPKIAKQIGDDISINAM